MSTGKDEHRVSFLVDPSMYEARHALPIAVYGDLEQVVRTDLQYHYSSPVCAQRWLDVCDDPAYGHRDLLRVVDRVFPHLISALQEDSGDGARVAFTSLGPGDGGLDERLLCHLSDAVEVDSYSGLDFSFELLRRAVHRISSSQSFSNGFPIRAVCGDFTDLRAYLPPGIDPDIVRLFSLTGFTLGNYPEMDLLARIASMMRKNDYLFIDARLHGLGEELRQDSLERLVQDVAARSYDLNSVKRFVFGPLEVATYATAEEVDICLEVSRALTSVPHAFNIVIYCTGLDTRMRLTEEPMKRDRLDLAVTSLYDSRALQGWFSSSGFRVVHAETDSGMGFFLLKPA